MRKVIYTCITGDYDDLKEPLELSDGFDHICFTDSASLTSPSWEMRPIPEQARNLTSSKMNRYVKILPHKALPEYDLSIWIDASITVKKDLNGLLENLTDSDIAIPVHPMRNCIYQEAEEVLAIKKDAKENVEPQMSRYRGEGFPEHYGLTQNNIIIRKHNSPSVIALMEDWWKELVAHSHRDQLSLSYVRWKHDGDVRFTELPKDTCSSKFFSWAPMHKRERIAKELMEIKKREEKRNSHGRFFF